MKRKLNKKAFTLVELLVVIAILAILATVSVVGYTAFIRDAHVSNDQKLADELSRVLEAHLVEGTINSEAELKEAIAKYMGSDDFAFEPESAEYGYHYWYDINDQKIVLVKSDELISSAGFRPLFLAHAEGEGNSVDNTFAPNSFRVFQGTDNKFYYLLDRVNEHSDTVKFIQALENADMTADEYSAIINNNSSTDGLVPFLQTNLAKIAIVNSTGMHVVGDGTEVKYVYIPNPAADDEDGYTLGSTGRVALPGVTSPITLPAGVKVGTDSLNNIGVAGTGDLLTGATEIHANLTEEQLKDYFSASSTTCVIVLPNADRYVVNGTEIIKLTAEGGESIGGTGYSDPVTSFTVESDGIAVDGQKKVHVEGDKIYVAYDYISGSFKLITDNFKNADGGATVSSQEVTWTTSDATGEYITVAQDGTVTIKKALVDNITITATAVASDNVSVTMTIVIDSVIKVDFAAGIFKSLDKDTSDNTISITYETDGNKSFTPVIEKVTTTGKGVEYDKSIKLEVIAADPSNGETTVLTQSGNTITLVNNGSGVVEGKQRLKITVANLSETYTVTVKDNSLSPFDTKYIVDADGTANDIKIGDLYLFRVGNANTIALGTLFTCDNPGSVTVNVDTTSYVEGLSCVVNSNDDWKKTTLQFTGTGIAKITVSNGSYSKNLIVEVVDGVNITDASASFSNSGYTTKNVVLLANLTVTSGKSISGGTLYGNGFTISAPTFYGNSKAILTLNNANIDNVLIIGGVYSEVQYSTGDYFTHTINAYGTCTISNSYISGCRSAIRLLSGDYVIENTTVDGGVFANIHVDAANSLVLKDVTTIQTLRPATLGNAVGENAIGLGIYVSTANVKITIEGDFKQYNWLSEDMISALRGKVLSQGAQAAMKQTEYKHTVNGKQYLNTGIIYENVPANPPVDNRTYIEGTTCVRTNIEYVYKVITESVSYEGIPATITAAVFSYTNTYPVNSLKDNNNNPIYINDVKDRFNYAEGSFVRSQAPTKPVVNITYNKNDVANPGNFGSYCQYDSSSKVIKLFVKENTTFTFDTNLLTATKHNDSLVVSATIQKKVDGAWVDIAWNGAFSSEAGDYRIKFSYSDPYQYDKDGEVKDAVTHTAYVDILLTVLVPEAQAPTFNFDNKGTSSTISVEIGDYTYVMPSATTYTTTVNDQTINYIVIDGTKESRTNVTTAGVLSRYYHILPKNQLVISEPDLNKSYDYSTKTMPSNLRGVNYTTISGSASTKTGFKLTVVTDSSPLYYEGQFNVSYGSGQNQPASHILIEYEYVGNNGTTYRYFLGYTFPKQDKSQCVTPETLVTLADGTQKEIQHVTYEDVLLVWNFETGKYDKAPASIVMNHGYDNYIVTSLKFSDGTVVNTINGHGFYDFDENKFVILDENNAADYIGHKFVKQDGDSYTTVTLVDYSIREEYIESWSVLTAVYHNAILEGLFTLTPAEVAGSPEYLMPFAVVDMKYDEAMMQADIEKYGLFTYEDFADYITYEEFVALNLKYFKVAVGKGAITLDDIMYLINLHCGK